jgi:glycine/D-amino acid oxidase-like deaminating enzyme
MTNRLPIAIIGAGPVGLAAASHLLERGETPLVLEAGAEAAASVRAWQHVQLFSPWRYNIDRAAERLLQKEGWTAPDPDSLPTGRDLRERYLVPLVTETPLANHIRYESKVVAVGRKGRDKMKTAGRGSRPFVLKVESGDTAKWVEAQAVIDASGTWHSPNPAGANGIAVPGEEAFGSFITYGIPDVRVNERARFAGATTLVVGSGHSAMHVILDLLKLQEDAPGTQIVWAMRSTSLTPDDFGGGADDALPARGALGEHAYAAFRDGRVRVAAPFLARAIEANALGTTRLRVLGEGHEEDAALDADRLVVATGFRPDLDMLREVRLDIDPVTESVADLAPLIDPNVHSCGTVPPHGVGELTHPEEGFFIAGMKSYGRAPTFLLATGYEQVRSIAAHLTGDHEAAARIELNLPETGVCNAPAPANGAGDSGAMSCCGPAPAVEPAETGCCTPEPVAELTSEPATAASTGCCA